MSAPPTDAPAGTEEVNWNRKVWRLAGPIMLANISIPLLSATDTAVAGRLPGPEFLGAVAVGALIFGVLYSGLNFLRIGTTGLTAQAYGTRSTDDVRVWLGRAVMASAAIGLAMTVLQVPIVWASFAIIQPSAEVRDLAETYVMIRIWGAPAALMNFALLGWFFGVQDTRAAMITQIYMNGANIVLDILFVLGFGWGVEGIAWATLASEVSALGLGLWIARTKLKRMGGGWDLERILHAAALKRMLSVNGDIFLRSMCLQAAFVAVTSYGARLGDTTLAANAVLMQFQLFTSFVLDGFAIAVEALAGEAVGARNRKRFRRAFWAAGRWALAFSMLFSGFYFAAGPALIDILTKVDEVRDLALTFLPWAALSPVVSIWCFHLDGVFIGATWTKAMRNAMILSLMGFFGALALFVPQWGNHGLWAAFLMFMAIRAVTLGVVYPGLERTVGGPALEK